VLENGPPRWKRLQDEALPIVSALRGGDLKALAEHLKLGGLQDTPSDVVSIPQWLADELVSMIEGKPWCWFHLRLVANKRGRTWSKDLDGNTERGLVGYFTERRIRELGRGSYDAAVQEACDRFGKRRTYVTDAHTAVKRYLERTRASPPDFEVDGWQVLSEVYSGQID
jgi:hypothetical protein